MKKVNCPACMIGTEPGRTTHDCDRCHNFGYVYVATRIVYDEETRRRVVEQVKKYNPAMSKGKKADKCLDKLIQLFCETYRNPWYSNTLSISSGGFTLTPDNTRDEKTVINIYLSVVVSDNTWVEVC